MRIQRVGHGDDHLLDEAVRAFRGAAVADHSLFLDDPATVALVATVDSALAGWAWGNRQRHVCGYSQVQLYEIEVAPRHRRRGVGRALLTEFIDIARQEGHRRMWLFTDEANDPAQSLYRNSGGEPSPHDDATFWWQL